MCDAELKRVEPDEIAEVIELFERLYYVDEPAESAKHFADHAAGGGETFLAHVGGQFAGFITYKMGFPKTHVSEWQKFRSSIICAYLNNINVAE